ncbi:MAG: MaoC/PaaZ C-terminal domain-containing protein [Gemmatimonadales bacterium]|nr:MaoC/PaaZ C-terminal domain-containing protein [Gemmatimonadales bacterium]
MTLPPLSLPPLSRVSLALYAGGSADHVPLHIDSDFAKAAGYPDVFMHGMLGCAYVSRVLTEWVPPERVRSLSARFVAITYPGEALTATGTIVERGVDGVATRCRVELELRNAAGERKLTGHAVVDAPEGSLP